MIDKKYKPFVSICIPVFNGENYLIECISSALQQDYSNFEVLIVDNCSTDTTSLLVSEIDDNRIRYIRNEKNIGALNNFSKCVCEAFGEYFVLLPHDDLLLPGFITEYVKRLEDDLIGLVYSSVKVIDAKGIVQYTRITHNENRIFNSHEAVYDLFDNFMPIQLAMVRTDVLRKVNDFDSNYGLFVDAQLWLKVFLDGWSCFFITEPYSSHRSHDGQGQAAFLELRLDILSDHWGKELDKEFWRKHGYNIYLLRLVRFVDNEVANKAEEYKHINNLLIELFVQSHLRFIILATIRLKGFVLWQEFLLFFPVFRLFGFSNVVFYYPWVFFKKIREKTISFIRKILV